MALGKTQEPGPMWRGGGGWAGRVHLLFQLGLGQQLWDEVQTDMDGGDASHS